MEAVAFGELAMPANRCPPREGHCRPPQDVLGKLAMFSHLSGAQSEDKCLGSMGSIIKVG